VDHWPTIDIWTRRYSERRCGLARAPCSRRPGTNDQNIRFDALHGVYLPALALFSPAIRAL
jgi:hypothetical protein